MILSSVIKVEIIILIIIAILSFITGVVINILDYKFKKDNKKLEAIRRNNYKTELNETKNLFNITKTIFNIKSKEKTKEEYYEEPVIIKVIEKEEKRSDNNEKINK